MAKAIHSMIRVLDEQRSLAFYDKAFGLRVAPEASPTDGLLDLVAVGPRSRAGFLRELARLRRGAVPLLRRAARVTLRAEGSPLDLVVRRDVLRVVAP